MGPLAGVTGRNVVVEPCVPVGAGMPPDPAGPARPTGPPEMAPGSASSVSLGLHVAVGMVRTRRSPVCGPLA